MGFFRKRKKVVKAQEFVLEDEEGRERAALRIDREKNALVSFKDQQGRMRLFAGLTPDGTPRVCLEYGGGKGSIQLEANDDINSAALIITGPSGTAQVMLGISRNGLPAFALLDEEGKRLFPLGPTKPDAPRGPQDSVVDWDDILKRI